MISFNYGFVFVIFEILRLCPYRVEIIENKFNSNWRAMWLYLTTIPIRYLPKSCHNPPIKIGLEVTRKWTETRAQGNVKLWKALLISLLDEGTWAIFRLFWKRKGEKYLKIVIVNGNILSKLQFQHILYYCTRFCRFSGIDPIVWSCTRAPCQNLWITHALL